MDCVLCGIMEALCVLGWLIGCLVSYFVRAVVFGVMASYGINRPRMRFGVAQRDISIYQYYVCALLCSDIVFVHSFISIVSFRIVAFIRHKSAVSLQA